MNNFINGAVFMFYSLILLTMLFGELSLFGREWGQNVPWSVSKIAFAAVCLGVVISSTLTTDW